MITIKQGADVDIGANPSAEEQDEGVEEGATQVNNVVYSHRLQSTVFDKKSYLVHLKVHTVRLRSIRCLFLTYVQSYMKAVKAELEKSNPERVAVFEKGAQAFAKKIVGNFKDYEFVCYFRTRSRSLTNVGL